MFVLYVVRMGLGAWGMDMGHGAWGTGAWINKHGARSKGLGAWGEVSKAKVMCKSSFINLLI